jgi:hemerythrin
VAPGTYHLSLQIGDNTYKTEAEILDNPLYNVSQSHYQEYDRFMSEMEAQLVEMHDMVNRLTGVSHQLREIISDVEDKTLKASGEALLERIQQWDDKMVQRKSKAYDDVENFPNKFTAEYLFLINQTEGSIPRVTNAARARRMELDKHWDGLKKEADILMSSAIPAFNSKLWEQGIGAIRE